MRNKIENFFKGHERTVKAKKNIIVSLFIKGMSIIVGFLMIRITLDYLDQTKYGIWLTLSSFMTWFAFFEIGLGRGLQNKLAEAIAVNDKKLAKIYVSTTYAVLIVIFSIVAILFFITNFFIDWTVVLNTEKSMADELTNLALIVFGFFFLRFVMNLISIILTADQRPAIANAFNPLGNLISLIIIYILTLTTDGSLIYLGLVLSIIPTIILILASIYFFRSEYNYLTPSLKFAKIEYAKNLLDLGFKFFIIQISSLIVYQSSNFIIAQFFGPDEVVVYNIGYKYFSVMIMVFTIIVTPFWSAFTEAWAKKEIKWIKNIIYKLLYICIALVVLGLIMLFFSDMFYKFWLGDKIKIPFNVSLIFLIYFITLNFGSVFKMFINGVGYVKLQMYSSIFASVIFIASSIIMIKYFNWGVESILIAMILSNFYGILIAPIQYYKIINNKAYGIWKS